MKTAIWIVVAIVVVVGGYLLYRSSYGNGSSGSSATVNTTSVSMKNFAFDPANISVTAGQEVTFTNNDSTTHTVTANDGTFESGDLGPGESFKKVFNTAGTFSYHCSIHTTMKGTVEVK